MGAVAFVMLRRPAAGIAAVLCMYALEQWARSQGGFLLAHQELSNIIVGVLVVFGVLLMLVKGKLNLSSYPRVGWVIAALFGFAAISFLWTIARPAYVQQWGEAFPYLVTIVILMPFLVNDWQDIRTGLFATMAMGAATLCLLAFMTQWTYRGVAVTSEQMGNPLAVASLGGYVVIIAALMNFQGLARVWQMLRWFVIALGVYIAVRSGSRGQVIGLLIAVLAFLPMSRRFASAKGFLGTVAAVVVMSGVAVWAQMEFAIGARWDWSAMTSVYEGSRMQMASTALDAWLHSNPLRWLIGLGNTGCFNPHVVGFYPHIVAVEVLVEEGLIGFALLCAVPILVGMSIMRMYRCVREDPISRGVLAAVSALFLFGVILSFKQGSLIKSPFPFAFAIVLGRMELALQRSLTTYYYPLRQALVARGQL